MKLFSHSKKEPSTISLKDAILLAQKDLDCAYNNFEHALEPELIDCYIYELQSAQMRLKFLLKCAKETSSTQ